MLCLWRNFTLTSPPDAIFAKAQTCFTFASAFGVCKSAVTFAGRYIIVYSAIAVIVHAIANL
jgi:hypothetical protein